MQSTTWQAPCQQEDSHFSFGKLQGDARTTAGVFASPRHVKIMVTVFTSLILQPTQVCLWAFALQRSSHGLSIAKHPILFNLDLLAAHDHILTETLSSCRFHRPSLWVFFSSRSTPLILLQVPFLYLLSTDPYYSKCGPNQAASTTSGL